MSLASSSPEFQGTWKQFPKFAPESCEKSMGFSLIPWIADLKTGN